MTCTAIVLWMTLCTILGGVSAYALGRGRRITSVRTQCIPLAPGVYWCRFALNGGDAFTAPAKFTRAGPTWYNMDSGTSVEAELAAALWSCEWQHRWSASESMEIM